MSARFRFFAALLVLLLGMCLTLLLHIEYKNKKINRINDDLLLTVDFFQSSIRKEIQSNFASIEMLRLLFQEKPSISRQEFGHYATPMLWGFSNMTAISWVPRVESEKAEAFAEAQSRVLGSPFTITELKQGGGRQPAGDRASYFPVTFIEPMASNRAALGYDISSDRSRKMALDLAFDQGKLAITPAVKLVQDPTGFGFLGVVPVWKSGQGEAEERTRDSLRGYISAVFKVERLLTKALQISQDSPLHLVAYDVTDGQGKAINGDPSLAEEFTLVAQRTIPVANRTWQLKFFAAPAYFEVKDSWLILLSGGVTSVFLCLLVLAPFLKERRNEAILDKLRRSQVEIQNKQESLAESESYNRLLFAETPIGLALTSLDGRLVDINPAFARIIGRTVDETLALTYWDLTPKKYFDQEKVQLQELETVGKYGPYEKEYIRADGSLVPVRLQGRLIEQKGETYIWSTVEDISQDKKAELELMQSEERFRTTFENSASGMCMTGLEGELVQVNARMCEMLEYPAAELVGKHFNSITLPEDSEIGQDIVSRMLAGEINSAAFEKRYLTRSGRTIWVGIHTALVRGPDGEPRYFITQMEDISERIIADNMLKSSEVKYKALVEQSLAGIYIFEKDKFLYVNSRFCEIFGYSEEEILRDLKPTDVVVREDRPVAQENIDRRLNGEVDSVHYRAQGKHKDGRELWVEIHGTHIPYQGKDVITGVVIDVTEKHVAEGARKKTADQYRALFEYAPDGILIADQNSNYLDANSSMCMMLGYTHEELVGLHASDIVVRAQIGNIKPALDTILGQGDYHKEWDFRRKDGSTFTAEVIATRMPDGNIMALVRDITERKRAQMLLEKSEERLRKAQRVASIGSWEMEVATGEIWASAESFRILGLDPEAEFLALEDIRFESGGAGEIRKALEHLIAGSAEFDAEFEIRGGTGGPITVARFIAELVQDEDGAPRTVLGVVMDITEDREKEEENLKLARQLQQAQKMESVGRLAGGVAHDFNNMLGVILGRTEMVLEKIDLCGEGLDPSVKPDLAEILEAGQRSASLTRQLLAFASRQTIAPTALDLNTSVNHMLKMLRRLIGEDIDLAWRPGADLWSVEMDPSQIDQILANLCVNARDAIGDTGNLTIETSNVAFDDSYCTDHEGFQPGQFVLLAVSDDGHGMDEETRSHLFEPFFTTKKMGEGTGLGLSTVYGIVKQNGGFVGVYSEPGQGTTFKIYLPRYVGDDQPQEAPAARAKEAGGDEVILLVEDEPAILNLASIMLRRFGYTVLAAGTPGEAIALARDYPRKIHLLITDVVMPEMNGRDLAGNLASSHPEIKCLFMSGYTANVIAHRGVLDPGVNFIQKPFSKDDLGMGVRKALEGSRGSRRGQTPPSKVTIFSSPTRSASPKASGWSESTSRTPITAPPPSRTGTTTSLLLRLSQATWPGKA